MKKISVVNQKGGVAKTTVTTNIAKGLSDKGFKVLVIDADPQSNSTSQLLQMKDDYSIADLKKQFCSTEEINEDNFINYLYNAVKNKNLQRDLSDVLLNKYDIDECIVKTKYQNIDLLPSSLNLSGVTSAMAMNQMNGVNVALILHNQLDLIEDNYDYLILDNAPSQDLILTNTLMITDYVIVPTQATTSSLSGMCNTINYLNKTKRNYKVDFELFVLFSIFNYRANNDKTLKEMFDKYFGERTFETFIRRRDAKVTENNDKCKLLIEDNSNISDDYKNLVEEIIEKI